MKKIVLLFCFLPLLLGACKKDDTPEPSSARMIPVKLTTGYDGEVHSVYELNYDEYERLTGFVCRDVRGITVTTVALTYDEQGLLTREKISARNVAGGEQVYAWEQINVFSHEGNRVTTGDDYTSYTFTLDDGGRIRSKAPTLYANESIAYRYDSGGNITSYHHSDKSFSTVGFDRKNGIYRWVNAPHWYLAGFSSLPHAGNVVNNAVVSAGANWVTETEYRYDGYDYPVFSTVTMIYSQPTLWHGYYPGYFPRVLETIQVEYRPSQRFWCGTE